MTKRSYIRIVSYIGFIMAIVITTSVLSIANMKEYKTALEVSYQQSLAELSECLNTINTDITKSLVSNSYGEIYDLSRDLYAQCSTAKNAMSRLPTKQMELNNAYKFLSQCSDYAQYIGTKIEKGDAISNEEHNNLKVLLGYAQKFNDQAEELVNIVNSGGMITEKQVMAKSEVNFKPISNAFSSSTKIFEDFPTLLYDGPFSDQVLNRNSRLVSASDVKTKEECQKIFAKALGVSPNNISYECDDKSKIPAYTFKCGRYTGLITKQGGYVKEILYSGQVRDTNITPENACNLAISKLKDLGYKDMKVSYYNTENNVCTVNCAYVKDDVYYYSDLIKIGISLDDGKAISLDTKTYLTNHKEREKKKPLITVNNAKSRLSKYLEVKASRLCVIPKESGNEVQCYEFTCKSLDTGEDVLVYINTDNGNEEDIMMLIHSVNGTLVK